jgi:hypothetical protein
LRQVDDLIDAGERDAIDADESLALVRAASEIESDWSGRCCRCRTGAVLVGGLRAFRGECFQGCLLLR